MPANFNSILFDRLPEDLEAVQRAVFYGDALFETIRMYNGRMPFLERHWARLYNGLQTLGFHVPDAWGTAFFQEEIGKIGLVNGRVRLTIWRSAGGLYLPEDHRPRFLITTQPMAPPPLEWPDNGIELGLCTTVRLPVDALSNLKTLNAPRYVAAARMAQANGWNDALLLNTRDRVCEATSSNIFWWEEQRLCTVPLSEGCVAGIMRRNILELASGLGYTVREKPVTFAALQQADEIFLSNAVRGLTPVRIFAGKPLADLKSKQIFDALNDQLAQFFL